jgi:Flp pilus assembly protein TadG
VRDVMAAHSAARAINTQDITDKARRDLLQLLEAVCKASFPAPLSYRILTQARFAAKRTSSLKGHWLALLACLSSSARFKSMA